MLRWNSAVEGGRYSIVGKGEKRVPKKKLSCAGIQRIKKKKNRKLSKQTALYMTMWHNDMATDGNRSVVGRGQGTQRAVA